MNFAAERKQAHNQTGYIIYNSKENAMARYVKIEDIEKFPIRINHCDRENGNIHFIFGIETVMEYIDYLPQYEYPDTEPVVKQDFD